MFFFSSHDEAKKIEKSKEVFFWRGGRRKKGESVYNTVRQWFSITVKSELFVAVGRLGVLSFFSSNLSRGETTLRRLERLRCVCNGSWFLVLVTTEGGGRRRGE